MALGIRRALRAIDRGVRAIRPGPLFWFLMLIDLAILAALAIFAFIPGEARLSVDAKTQVAEVVVAEGHGFNAWGKIAPVEIGPNEIYTQCLKPVLVMPAQLAGPMTFSAKMAADKSLSITFRDFRSGALGTLTCAGTERKIDGYLVLTWDAEQAKRLALQFAGKLSIGDYFADESAPSILEEGNISAEATGMLIDDDRVSSETKLYPGDYVVMGDAPGETSIAHGLLRVVDGKMQVTAHIVAKEALVTHIGQQETGPESVAPSFFAKVQAQSHWALLLLMVAVFLHMISSLQDYVFERTVEEEKEEEKRDG